MEKPPSASGRTGSEMHNDFYLMSLNHLEHDINMPESYASRLALAVRNGDSKKAEKIGRIMKKEIARRQSVAKKAIEEHTREGEAIAFENPEPASFEIFRREMMQSPSFEAYSQSRILAPHVDGWVSRMWENGMRESANFYADIAEYARSRGRRIVSLEPPSRRLGSSRRAALVRASLASGLNENIVRPELRDEVRRSNELEAAKSDMARYLLTFKADTAFRRKVAQEKPAMVIAAHGHGVALEGAVTPRRGLSYFPRVSQSRKLEIQSMMQEARDAYALGRKKRLEHKKEVAKRRHK
jgi:hypothetical protein